MNLDMNLEALVGEIKEFADECVDKQREECIEANDSMIINYLKTLLYEKDFQIFLKYKETMLKVFKDRVKEDLEWLNE